MEFCIEQYTDDGQHIYKQVLRTGTSYEILSSGFLLMQYFGHVCDILV